MEGAARLSAVHVIVRGRVQGVSYRDALRLRATESAVRGWVRNTDDGAVEALLVGRPTAVDRLIDWMRTGPEEAVVLKLVTEPATDPGGDGFQILR
ncbi:acylphosphatase [Mumia zhuanghuii]|uniref:acylphosphatase n=2 Tax=Mumia TaxID=1546255 RepID=A0ABW1QF30_9ACTN|nr:MULTISPECIES: acylphosphatase [Mumia]KAA1422891.1 acylphosphatase [Mumia zhuanghuii]